MKDKGITGIGYNYLNLPDSFGISQADPFLGNNVNFRLDYLYRADGTKVRKTYSTGGGRGQSTSYKHTDYLDGFQYSFSETVQPCAWCRTSVAYEQEAFKDPAPFDPTPISLGWQLDFVPTAEGFYSFTENRYIYQYRDHLGNARVSYGKNSHGALEITDTNNYYAFGMNHIGGMKSMLGAYQNYKYNGKELQETGMYDYGARFYIPDIGRWGVIDPLAEKSTRFSPYNYAVNNPIRFIDPDGRENEDWVKRGSQIFYDASVKTQAQATAAYGESAQHLGEGSTVTSTTNGQADGEFQYTLHNNGTVSDASGKVMDNTQEIQARDKTIFSNCSDCLNPGTLNKNLFGLTYPGGDNPKTYGGDWSYQYNPSLLSEYPAIGHDRRYDNLGTEGAMGLLTDTRAIGADYTFVAQELKIALNPFNGAISPDKQAAGMLGVGLGIAAAPKTIFKLATDNNAFYNIYQDYKTSNKGVSNTPKK